jgi:Zn-dependent peptidase ImmA (M78 family)
LRDVQLVNHSDSVPADGAVEALIPNTKPQQEPLMAAFHDRLGRPAPDYRLVKRVADRVLDENVITEPPVLAKDICHNYGIGVLFADFGNLSSEVAGFFDFSTKKIFVNRADPGNRQVFTIAHEFGHYMLHAALFASHSDEYKVLMRAPLGGVKDPLEQEANAFAANLLVPRQFLDRYYRIASSAELARLFIVSEEVIRYRLKLEYDVAA